MIRQISLIAIGAIAIGVFLGTSLAPAATAMGFFFPRNIQSINQVNQCNQGSFCTNAGTNTANSFPFSSRQSISQLNECSASTCENTATNTVK